jgi:antitoxin CptB
LAAYLFRDGCDKPQRATARTGVGAVSARAAPPLTIMDQRFDDLDIRRRRIRFRAWRRGMREMDLIMGGFVDSEIRALDAGELDVLEALLDADDDAVYGWLCGSAAAPPAYDTPLFRRIAAFHADGPLERGRGA